MTDTVHDVMQDNKSTVMYHLRKKLEDVLVHNRQDTIYAAPDINNEFSYYSTRTIDKMQLQHN